MLQRRKFVSGVGRAGLGVAAIWFISHARAQRPAQPIARPPGPRPGGPLVPGRFESEGGVAFGAVPGVYVVVAVRAMCRSKSCCGLNSKGMSGASKS